MKQIVNVKRIFIDDDFDFLVELLTDIKGDTHHRFSSCDVDGEYHGKELQIIGHRLYTHPQNPTLNVLEVDYVNHVDTTTSTEENQPTSNVSTSEKDC